MKTVAVQSLSADAFQPFGSFANMIDPKNFGFGEPPVQFVRDIIQATFGGPTAVSFSVCRVEARPMVIDAAEYHNRCCEAIMPLDNDVLIHVAPGTSPAAPPPVDLFQVFRVPQGTLVVLRPGVWHLAPYTVNDKPANVLVVLPERTYANDCVFVPFPEGQSLEIVGY